METSSFRRKPVFAGVTTFLFLLFISGCKTEPLKPPLVQSLVILPFDNESNNLNAPDILQSLTYGALKCSPYQVLDIKDTNAKLADKGVVDGGQLAAMDPVKIGQDFGVQALVYGYVSYFGYINIGFYRARKVGLDLKMVDAKTGQTIWENSGTINNMKVALNVKDAKDQFTKGVADQAADKLFKAPLDEEARMAVAKTLHTLPGFLFNGFGNTPASNPVKNVIRSRINQ